MCFGVFDPENKQAAFASVVTDYAMFAWLLDVFILENHRGKGLGKLLKAAIMAHKDLQGLKRWGLGTMDAHGLYDKYGFKALSRPERTSPSILFKYTLMPFGRLRQAQIRFAYLMFKVQ